MCLLEDHVLQELLGDGILLLDGAVGTTFLPRHHSCGLRGEQHTAGGDVLSTAVLSFLDTDAGEAHLEDADAVQLHLLSQLEEVLHGTAQLVEHGIKGTGPCDSSNIIKLPKDIHRKISGYYSSIQKETDYMRVRDWLNGKSYEFQYEYGLEVLKRYGY